MCFDREFLCDLPTLGISSRKVFVISFIHSKYLFLSPWVFLVVNTSCPSFDRSTFGNIVYKLIPLSTKVVSKIQIGLLNQ